jgi:general secretion pathway protein D
MKSPITIHLISHLLIACQLCFSVSPYALAATRFVRVQAVRITLEDGAMMAVIELDSIAAFTHSTLSNPPRVIVDIKAALQTIRPLARADEQIVLPVGAGGIQRARIGQMNNIVRVVFDVTKLGLYTIERRGTELLVRFPRSSSESLQQVWTTTPSAVPEKTGALKATMPMTPVKTVTTETTLAVEMPAPVLLPAIAPTRPQPMPELKVAEKAISTREGKKNFAEGKRYESQQQWEQAAQQFIVAAAAEPNNPEYQLHLLRAKRNAALLLAGRGDTLAEQRDYEGAYRAYRQATAYDEANELVRVKMQRMMTQSAASTPANYNTRTGNYIATSADLVPPNRSRTRDLLQVIHFDGARLRQVIERLSADLGLNVLFDESFKDEDKFRFKVQDVTLARAFDMILVQTKHLFEQVDRRTILIYADTPAHRQRFEQLLVKTFYLGSADANDVKATLHQMIGPQRQIAIIKQLNALIVRDTIANLKMVQELIDSIDKHRAEVVVDVDIYEVARSTSLEIGNQLATNGMPVTETRFGAQGNPVTITTGSSASLGNLGGVGRAGIAAIAGNTAAPVLGGVGTLLGLPPSSLSLLQTKGKSHLLASTQIHALDGEQNQTKVGRSVPVRIGSTYVPGLSSAPGAASGMLGGGAFDSIQYRDVGLVIDVTPTVSNEGYVQLRMKLESTNVEASGADLMLTPSFTQRSLSTIARVVDNKTAVVAGIKQENKGESRVGLPVLSMLPLLGRFITTPRQNGNFSDIIITVTPHILRAPELKKEDHLARFSGTFVAGVTQSVEDVAQRAQSEDDQEQRITNRPSLIAKDESRASTATPVNGTATAAATVPASMSAVQPVMSPANDDADASAVAPPNVIDLSLIPATITTESGGSFFVVAAVYGDAKMNEAQLAISFDPVLLQCKSVRSGGLFGQDAKLTHEVVDGELQIRLRQTTDRETPIAASGQLVLIEFAALHEGETFLTLRRATTELRLGRKAVPYNPINAQVQIGKAVNARANNQ